MLTNKDVSKEAQIEYYIEHYTYLAEKFYKMYEEAKFIDKRLYRELYNAFCAFIKSLKNIQQGWNEVDYAEK